MWLSMSGFVCSSASGWPCSGDCSRQTHQMGILGKIGNGICGEEDSAGQRRRKQ
jgi:hypothetical protein